MDALLSGLGDGLDLIVSGDQTLVDIALRTLRIGFESTAIALALGVPAGVVLGRGRFRGRRALLSVANAGLRVPPVALGLILWLLMWPNSSHGRGLLADLGWLYTINAVILAQTLLVLPIVVALTAAAVQAVPGVLIDQARAFGASGWRCGLLALREARVGVFAAAIAALGSAIASVGAILVVGSSLGTQTLATAAVSEWNMGGSDARAVAYGTVLLGIFLILAAILTTAQHRNVAWVPTRAS
jgi:tungstate transport system permease protein